MIIANLAPCQFCIKESNRNSQFKGTSQGACLFCRQKRWVKIIYLHVHVYRSIPLFHYTTGCFKDHIVGEDLIADYLLYILNKTKNFE